MLHCFSARPESDVKLAQSVIRLSVAGTVQTTRRERLVEHLDRGEAMPLLTFKNAEVHQSRAESRIEAEGPFKAAACLIEAPQLHERPTAIRKWPPRCGECRVFRQGVAMRNRVRIAPHLRKQSGEIQSSLLSRTRIIATAGELQSVQQEGLRSRGLPLAAIGLSKPEVSLGIFRIHLQGRGQLENGHARAIRRQIVDPEIALRARLRDPWLLFRGVRGRTASERSDAERC